MQLVACSYFNGTLPHPYPLLPNVALRQHQLKESFRLNSSIQGKYSETVNIWFEGHYKGSGNDSADSRCYGD